METYSESKIAETKIGPIEYAIQGEGDPLLVIHGGIGGYDQGLFISSWVKDYKIISPSRPGYLRTPAELGQTAEDQANAMIALLDSLQIDKVAIFTFSAGGYVAYTIAVNYPERIKALIVADGVSGKYLMPSNAGWFAQMLFLSNIGLKLINKISELSPKSAVSSLLNTEALFNKQQLKSHVDEILKDKNKIDIVLGITRLLSPYNLRKVGTDLDMKICSELPIYLDLTKIDCPSLIVHGTHDGDVLFYHGASAAKQISNAQSCWIYEGSHFSFFISNQAEAVQQQARDLLDKSFGRQGSS